MMNEKDGSNNKGKVAIIILSSPQTNRLQSSVTGSLLRNLTDTEKSRTLTPEEKLTRLTDSIEQHVKATYLNEGLIDKHRYERFVKFSSDEKKDLRQNDLELYKRVLKNRGWKAMAAHITSQFSADKGANVQVADDFDIYCKDKEREMHLPELITYNVARQHPVPRTSTIKLKMNDRNARIPIAVFHKITSRQTKEKVIQRMIDYLDREVGTAVDVHFHTTVVNEAINSICYEIEKYVRPTIPPETEADEEGIAQFYNFIMTTIDHVLASMEKQLLTLESYQIILPVIQQALAPALDYVAQKIKDSSSMYPNHLPQLDATLRGIYTATQSSQKILEGLDSRYSTLRCESVVNTTLVSACDPEILNSFFSNMWIQEATETIQAASRKSTATNTLSQNTEKTQPTAKLLHTIENAPKVKEISSTAQAAIEIVLGSVSQEKKDHLKKILEKIWRKQTNLDRSRLVAGFDIAMDQTQAAQRQEQAKKAGFSFYTKGEKHNVVQKQQPIVSEDKSTTIDKNESVGDSVIKPLVYPTLELLKADPSLLTGEKLVQIFKEMGYRFLDERQFRKEADQFLTNGGLKNGIIRLLEKDESLIWHYRKISEGSSYRRMPVLGRKLRIVKQGNTILWLTNYDTYKDRTDQCFITDKRDFDKELDKALGPRDREAAIAQYQPKVTDKEDKRKDYTQRTTQFTIDNTDELTKGA